MAERPRNILICSCEDTMPLAGETVARVCRGAKVIEGRQLCRAELERFRKLATGGTPLTVACTQEAPLFEEVAGEIKDAAELSFVNIRETAGWSTDAKAAGPKMAALIAASLEPVPEVAFVPLTSDGVTLIYGKDEQAIEAANLLKEHLDVTVLIKPPGDVSPLRTTEFPVVKGNIRQAKGYLGAFELTVDDYAAPNPSSRGELTFGPARNGATSRCDIVLDLSGGASLFAAADLRDGYLRADPGDPAAVLRAVLKARDLTGTFDKPRYINFTEDLCAHSRSKIVGCRRCLDLCPTGAIAPNGDHVAIDPQICAGCGQCAAACPTGAAAYALPPSDALLRRLRTLLGAYREAGGQPGGGAVPRRRAWRRIDRRAGAARRRLAGKCIAGAGQRSDASWTGIGRGVVCLRRVRGALSRSRQAAPRYCRPRQDHRAGGADPRRPRLCRGACRNHRDRRSGRARQRLARHSRHGCCRQARHLRGRRAQARRGAPCLARAACGGPGAGRHRRAAAGRAVRHRRSECRGLHAVSLLRLDLPDRRAVGRSRAADVAFRGRRLRAMRIVQGDLSGKGDLAQAADRFPCRDRGEPHHQAGRAVRLHPLRQAVRRQEFGRARGRQAGRPALDVSRFQDAARRHQDVRRLPRRGHDGGEFRSLRRSQAPGGAHHRRLLCASANWKSSSANTKKSKSSDRSDAGGGHPISWSPSPEIPPAPCGPRPSRSSAPASWCRACRSSDRPRTFSPPSPASTRYSCA